MSWLLKETGFFSVMRKRGQIQVFWWKNKEKLPCDGFSFLLISTKSKETTRDLKFGCILDGVEDEEL